MKSLWKVFTKSIVRFFLRIYSSSLILAWSNGFECWVYSPMNEVPSNKLLIFSFSASLSIMRHLLVFFLLGLDIVCDICFITRVILLTGAAFGFFLGGGEASFYYSGVSCKILSMSSSIMSMIGERSCDMSYLWILTEPLRIMYIVFLSSFILLPWQILGFFKFRSFICIAISACWVSRNSFLLRFEFLAKTWLKLSLIICL